MLPQHCRRAIERAKKPDASPVLAENAPLVANVQHDHQPALCVLDDSALDLMRCVLRKRLEMRGRQYLQTQRLHFNNHFIPHAPYFINIIKFRQIKNVWTRVHVFDPSSRLSDYSITLFIK